MDNAECLAEFRFFVKCSDYQKGLYATLTLYTYLRNQYHQGISKYTLMQFIPKVEHWITAVALYGTVRPICRHSKLQITMYNGHKRVHAMKFQSVTLPNGMIAHLYGPVVRRIYLTIRQNAINLHGLF